MMEELQTQRAMIEKFTLQLSKSTSASPQNGTLASESCEQDQGSTCRIFASSGGKFRKSGKGFGQSGQSSSQSWCLSESDEDVLVLEAKESMTNPQIERANRQAIWILSQPR